ncbi:hypothetical protein Agub_g8807 [Astrephomene gubernaculifera]|uniref:EF-hand domain-containing protein n=1 Tax=Astrephomene gubernaculifera TaxID=47775 RepID=A0AAD3HNS9_9CHLO|nr:hypothetical protein Agub_g8807 [Astrephomene gubernaculifera]
MFNIGQDGRRPGSSSLPQVSLTGSGPGRGKSSRSGTAGQSQGGVPRPGYIPKYSAETANSTDAINQDILRRVKAKFDSADMDGTGQLHPQEFIKAFLGILQTEDGGDADALAKLFMRIDVNSDGTVDWDEFSTYMLLESQGSARVREFESTVTMQEAEPSPVPDMLAHKDAMTHITAMRLANGVDRYATCGRDGTVRLWNAKDLKHVKTLHLPRPRAPPPARDGAERLTSARGSRPVNSGGLWATCSAFMPLTQKLAVGSFSRSIRIYDLASYEIAGQIPEIDFVPLCLDVWVPSRAKDSELMVVGDGGGWVRLFEVRSSAGGGAGAESDTVVAAAAAAAANSTGSSSSVERLTEKPRWRYHHHSDWVMAVKYVADMNCVLAASLDKTVSITDAEERVPLKKLEGHHTKGVNAVDWSSLYKFVATGSLDRRVIMWNPFSQKPLAVLSGHNAAVTGVVVNDRDNQIISLSTDHVIKIWDIRNHKCVQSLPDRELLTMPQSSSDDAVTPVLYDPERRQLVTGYLRPKVWKMTTAGAGATQAHSAAVTRVIYNSNFSEAISADHAGTVSVWHVPTGKLRYRFLQCHGDKRITALAFDAAKRRLITGAEDGDCKIWNFSSGACLSHLQSKTHAEITALVPLRGPLTRYVLAAGWDRRITFYEDNAAKAVGPSRSLAGHKADILAMVALEGSSTVVTASDDGELWVWNMDSCAPKRRMVAPGTATRPANERAVEALAFLAGSGVGSRLRGVLVAVGADRWLRLWDVLDGTLLAERFTGHRQGETVQALALEGSNTRIATGDSGGMIKVWDMSRYSGGTLTQPQAASVFREIAVWRGHKSHVTSLDWVDSSSPSNSAGGGSGLGGGIPGSGGGGGVSAGGGGPHGGSMGGGHAGGGFAGGVHGGGGFGGGAGGGGVAARRGLFLVSSSADCTVALWTESGVRVGTFGQNTWALEDRTTWVEQKTIPLDERDSWIMEASLIIPSSDPAISGAGDNALANAASLNSSATLVAATIANAQGLGFGDGIPRSAALARRLGNRKVTTAASISSRPDSAPPEIALVCEVSNALRAERRNSVRRAAGSRALSFAARSSAATSFASHVMSGMPAAAAAAAAAAAVAAVETDGGAAATSTGDGGPGRAAGSHSVSYGGAFYADGSSAFAQSHLLTADGGESEQESTDMGEMSSSSSSEDHASDTEVPTALWLHDFDAARHRRLLTTPGNTRDGGGGWSSGSKAYGPGGRAGVAHLLKVSELAMLQERPPPTVMSSRRGVATAAGVLTKSSEISPMRLRTPGSASRKR